jgi:putative transposase
LVSSNGDDCSMPKLLRKNLASLRNLSEKYRKSKGKRGSLRTLQKLHEKVANQRSDMHWKLARQMCHDYDVMVFETLDLANLSKKYKKSMYDFGFNAFLNILEYVAHRTGKTVMYADKYFASSQLCSSCGYKNTALKDIGIRHWICPKCGVEHDRDFNAALNLQKVGASAFSLCCSN